MQKTSTISTQHLPIHSLVHNRPSTFFKPFIQPRLTVNQPNDIYEQEADAVADKIMRMADKDVAQTKFFQPAISTIQRKCGHCEEEEKKMQRKEMNDEEMTADHGLESYVGGLNSGGQTLPDKVRNFFEPRLGYDFSNVKVHTDSVAAKSAQSINALAYTSGNNIVFNNGQYAPDTDSGKRLLGHELTHVVHQSGNINTSLIQRTVSAMEVNCGTNQVVFNTQNGIRSYNLRTCDVTAGTYNANVSVHGNNVSFTLTNAPPGIHSSFPYDIRRGQDNPSTFFRGQRTVTIHFVPLGAGGDSPTVDQAAIQPGIQALNQQGYQFHVRRLTPEEYQQLTGQAASALPSNRLTPVAPAAGNNTVSSIVIPAATGAGIFSVSPWTFIPNDSTGIFWSGDHMSVWSNPSGAAPTVRGYRADFINFLGEYLPGAAGRRFTIALNEGMPAVFQNDSFYPYLPNITGRNSTFLYVLRGNEEATAFAGRLNNTQYGGNFQYSPPRGTADPILGDVGSSEAQLRETLLTRGRAPMCANNCTTVPIPEIEAAVGMRPTTPTGIDVTTGANSSGAITPAYAGRARLTTQAVGEGPLAPGVGRLSITPAATNTMFVLKGAGGLLLLYGIYRTSARVAENYGTPDQNRVIAEEAGGWAGGLLASALGTAVVAGLVCAPSGPLDVVCVLGGFAGGLLFGAIGSAAGSSIAGSVESNVESGLRLLADPARLIETSTLMFGSPQDIRNYYELREIETGEPDPGSIF